MPFDTPTGRRVFSGAYPIANTPLQPFITSALSTFATAQMFLVDSTDTAIAASRPELTGEKIPADLQAAAAHDTALLGASTDERFVTAVGIANTRWRLIAVISTKELYAPLSGPGHWAPFAVLVGFAIVAALAVALTTRSIARKAGDADDRARQQSIIETASDAFVGMDPDGRVTDWNLAATRLFGWSATDARGNLVANLIIPARDAAAHSNGLRDFLKIGVPRLPASPLAVTAQHQDGHEIPVELTVARTRWRGGWRFHAFIRDMTDQHAQTKALETLALTDGLTGLANRRAFMDRLTQARAASLRHSSALGILYIDVDHFKEVNDAFGHSAGDALLRQVAARLLETFRAEDSIARLGGDEFAVLCEDTDTLAGDRIAARVRESLARPYTFRGQPLLVTASVGMSVGVVSSPTDTPERLLERADALMYEAKATTEAWIAVTGQRETE